jgi:hypothetical protein
VPGQGVVVVEEVKEVKYAPMPPRMYENREKTGVFAQFLAYKLLKMPFFAQKYFTKYTPETFFIIFILTKKRKYNADTSLQERRQEKDMFIWCLKRRIESVFHQALLRGE